MFNKAEIHGDWSTGLLHMTLGKDIKLIEQGKHEREHEERNGEVQQTAQEGLLGAVEQGHRTRQRGADDERDKEQERERQDNGQREDALAEPGPAPRPHPAGRGWLDLPDEVQRRLELAEDGGGANEQRDQAHDGRERPPPVGSSQRECW